MSTISWRSARTLRLSFHTTAVCDASARGHQRTPPCIGTCCSRTSTSLQRCSCTPPPAAFLYSSCQYLSVSGGLMPSAPPSTSHRLVTARPSITISRLQTAWRGLRMVADGRAACCSRVVPLQCATRQDPHVARLVRRCSQSTIAALGGKCATWSTRAAGTKAAATRRHLRVGTLLQRIGSSGWTPRPT